MAPKKIFEVSNLMRTSVIWKIDKNIEKSLNGFILNFFLFPFSVIDYGKKKIIDPNFPGN